MCHKLIEVNYNHVDNFLSEWAKQNGDCGKNAGKSVMYFQPITAIIG